MPGPNLTPRERLRWVAFSSDVLRAVRNDRQLTLFNRVVMNYHIGAATYQEVVDTLIEITSPYHPLVFRLRREFAPPPADEDGWSLQPLPPIIPLAPLTPPPADENRENSTEWDFTFSGPEFAANFLRDVRKVAVSQEKLQSFAGHLERLLAGEMRKVGFDRSLWEYNCAQR